MCGLLMSVLALMVGGFLRFPVWLPRDNNMFFLQDCVGGTLIGRPHCNSEHGFENCPGYFSILCALSARFDLSVEQLFYSSPFYIAMT